MLNFQLAKYFPLDSESLFQFFSKAENLEKWATPEGMTLRIPIFDFVVGGKYRFEHSNQDGTYVCEGEFREITPQKKIIEMDRFVKDPKGKIVHENLACVIDFQENFGGTEIYITQSGFKDENSLEQCRQGWEDSLNLLQEIVASGPNINTGKNNIDQEGRFI